MTDRDQFAAAALTGLLAQGDDGSFSEEYYARGAYRWADAMLREREKTSVGVTGMDPVTDRKSAATPGACASPCSQPFDSAPITLDAYRQFVGEVMNWISEATSAYASSCSSDGGRKIMADACCQCWDAFDRIACPTIHGASPEARASVDSVVPQPTPRGDSDRTDKAAPRPSEGTGDTPATHATHGEGSVRRECTEPVAWGVANGKGLLATSISRIDAVDMQSEYACDTEIVPLYRHPPCQDLSRKNLTLTDAEREAVERASIAYELLPTEGAQQVSATLRGLLERLGGGR